MEMANHWWWRPGWSAGRRFYTWHITFAGNDCADLHRLAADYRKALAPLPGLGLIPDQWLHLTMQGVGFIDEVQEHDVTRIVEAAQARLAAVPAFDLTFTRPLVTPEAVQWAVDPRGPNAVRDAIREAIADVWPDVPEPADGFKAHVSIAYSSATGPAGPIETGLDSIDPGPASVRVREAALIVLHRDRRMYEWETYGAVALGE